MSSDKPITVAVATYNNKAEVRKMSDVLEAGQFGLVVVAVNPKGTDLEALLVNAVAKVVSVDVADPAGAVADAFETVDG